MCSVFSCIVAVLTAGDRRMSSPLVAQRLLGDATTAADVTENPSPKVEQLVITPFDEGMSTFDVYLHFTLPVGDFTF